MTRSAALGFALLLLSLSSLCSAQTADGSFAGGQPALPSDLPSFDPHVVPGESVVELADFVTGYLAETGALPDFAQVRTADARLRGISMADAFALLARTAYLWQATDQLPATVPIAPDEVSAPVPDFEDLPTAESDAETGVEVSTEQFLSVCADTVRWIDRLRVIPTAIWVDGVRLSAAQYLAGLAICIQYAYWEGELYDYLHLPDYSPPQAWIPAELSGPLRQPAQSYEEQWVDETSWLEESAPVWTPAAPAGLEEQGQLQGQALGPLPVPAARDMIAWIEPELALYPEPGTTVGGIADLVASYSGPPERFVIFEMDGRSQVIKNFPPYSYRWDTSGLTPGVHTVRVQVLGDGDAVLIDQVNAYTVVPVSDDGLEWDPMDDL
jgi:hypothetical protein